MLILLTLLTASYFAAVIWVRHGTRQRAAAAAGAVVQLVVLPAEDQPPSSAVGWPPGGSQFSAYVDQGFQALDAYLAEGFAT